jgi:hypothetical protein
LSDDNTLKPSTAIKKSMPEPPQDFQKATDPELVIEAQTGTRGQGANVEMMRRLRNAIERFDASTTRYSKILMWLTIIIGLLTAGQFSPAAAPTRPRPKS